MKKRTILITLIAAVFVLIIAGAYSAWNNLSPDRTCASCHELRASHERWSTSAHAEVHCVECHGTAFSEGFHSLSEKVGMVVTHFTKSVSNDDIKLNEEQMLRVADRCAACHQAEYAGWMRSGHAVTYGEIFEDSTHNAMEKPYWDCLRCHGMFYEGNIHELMSLESTDPTDWKIRDPQQVGKPAVPCLACHRVHTENPVSDRYVSMTDATRAEADRNPIASLYMRDEKIHLRADYLTHKTMIDSTGREVAVADDPNTWLCMQCHAPNTRREAGSEDDRTVTGVHEGISCVVCHKPHSGETRESCAACHTGLTEEQIQIVFENPHSYAKQ